MGAKMRVFVCTSSPPPLIPPTNTSEKVPLLYPPQKTLILRALTSSAISFTLLFSSPAVLSSIALDSVQIPPPPSSSSSFYVNEICRSEEEAKRDGESELLETAPDLVTNEDIVEEAWQVVNDSFLDAGGRNRHPWSPQSWIKKKEDLVGTSIRSRSNAHNIIRRMLASLGDPYTRFLSPTEFSKMARYDMSGIGVNLREIPVDNGRIKLMVLGLILDGPAYTAGVRQGDELLSVNGVDVRGKSALEALSLLQGPSETSVNIMVKHGNCGPVQSIEIKRQLVARTPVSYRLEQRENGAISVGYVHLREFNALARKDLVTAMKRLQGMDVSFFILDLRDNLGGLVQEGIEIAKLFLNEGETIIYTVGREPQSLKSIVVETAPLVTAPVIVLVNKNTASASEIVAAALHDNCRAILVGERTYGKGLIQSVFELHDGSGVVVTVGKYVTPNHMDINGNGIEPDFRKLPALNEVVEHLSKCQRKQG